MIQSFEFQDIGANFEANSKQVWTLWFNFNGIQRVKIKILFIWMAAASCVV